MFSIFPMLICMSLSTRVKVHKNFPNFLSLEHFLVEYQSTSCKTLAPKESHLGDAILNPSVRLLLLLT